MKRNYYLLLFMFILVTFLLSNVEATANYSSNKNKVLFYKFNVPSTTNVKNELGILNATYFTAPQYQISNFTGFNNASYHLGSQLMTANFTWNSSLTSLFSIEFRINPADVVSDGFFVIGTPASQGTGLAFSGSSGLISWSIGGCGQINDIGNILQQNKNAHIVMTRNANNWKLYLDAVLVNSRTCALGTFADNLSFGLDPSSYFGGSYTGQVEQMVLWDFELAQDDINTLNATVTDNSSGAQFSRTLDDCTVNSIQLLNYTLFDEDTQSFLTPSITTLNTTIDLQVNLTSKIDSTTFTFSKRYNNTNPARVCVDASISTAYRLDAISLYSSTSRVTERHNIQNITISNSTSPINIALYDLLSANSQEFLISYKDSSLIPLTDALIDISRQYINQGIFKSVEIPKTDSLGQTIGHFNLDNILYTITISKNGQLFSVFDNVIPICQDQSSGKCTINLNALLTGAEPMDWSSYRNVTLSTPIFNATARTITILFTTLDGTSQIISLNTTLLTNYGNVSACSVGVSSSSGTLLCTIPSNINNGTLISEVYINGKRVTRYFYSLKESSESRLGKIRGILVFLLVCSLALMFITNSTGIVIGGILGLILSLFLGIADGSIIGVGSAIIWLIVAGCIIIWQVKR